MGGGQAGGEGPVWELYTTWMPVIGRFAPSPTGTLHLGNLRTALASWLSAKAADGKWIIRIEDVDGARSRSALVEEHLRDLAALGLESDEPVLFQSARGEAYAAALQRLSDLGALYPCACTRKDLALLASAPHDDDGLRPYPGTCRGRKQDALRPEALRYHLPGGSVHWEDRVLGSREDDPSSTTGDPLLHRRDGCYAYHLAVVVDDGAQGVTEIVRGADLSSVTATQIRLQEALGLPRPAYAHLGLVLGPGGSRLSKRGDALGLQAVASRGQSMADIVGWLGWSLGCLDQPRPCSVGELVHSFRWDRVPAGSIQILDHWGRK